MPIFICPFILPPDVISDLLVFTKLARPLIMAQMDGPFLHVHKVNDGVQCSMLPLLKRFYSTLSFKAAPACGSGASVIHFWPGLTYQAKPSINQAQVYPPP